MAAESESSKPAAGLSEEEFQRLQKQLLDLRTENYKLEEANNRLKNDNNQTVGKLRSLEEEALKSAKSLFRPLKRGGSSKDADSVEEEMRKQLLVQEENFRLQQATLMEELNKVVQHSDSLEKELAEVKSRNSLNDVTDAFDCDQGAPSLPSSSQEMLQLRQENGRLKATLQEMREKHELEAKEWRNRVDQAREESESQLRDAPNLEDIADLQSKFTQLEAELGSMKEAKEKANTELSSLHSRLSEEKAEYDRKLTELKQEVTSINDKFRRKQESYVQLNQEKERQYQEFKKSLDTVVNKKDTEIATYLNEIKQLQQLKEQEAIWQAEKASLEQEIINLRASQSEIRDLNEAYQIQLQETHSANDCISAQLQQAKADVANMDQRVKVAEEAAEKRKSLLDEMAAHLEQVKCESKSELDQMRTSYEERISQLQNQLSAAEKTTENIQNLTVSAQEAETSVQHLTTEKNALQERLDLLEVNSRKESAEAEAALFQLKQQKEAELNILKAQMDDEQRRLKQEITELTNDKSICMDSIARLKQEVKDREGDVKLSEKKQHALLKDLKRQAASERKRADRLQEKLQELINTDTSAARNRSPGFEELKASDIVDAKRVHNDSGSVSSWTMVTGSSNNKMDADRHSNTPDNDSESSTTHLDAENQDLLTRITRLQRSNFELQEKVQMLEESSAAMAEDLVNKSAIIEQYVKEKPGMIQPGSPQHTVGVTQLDKLQGGLKKVMDMVKMDQSAGDIREMNRRLQLMLEESLTKNMHLQSDLEIMSQELARFTSPTVEK